MKPSVGISHIQSPNSKSFVLFREEVACTPSSYSPRTDTEQERVSTCTFFTTEVVTRRLEYGTSSGSCTLLESVKQLQENQIISPQLVSQKRQTDDGESIYDVSRTTSLRPYSGYRDGQLSPKCVGGLFIL